MNIYHFYVLIQGSFCNYRAVAFVLTTLYLLMLYGLYVPDWEYRIPTYASSGAEVFKVGA